ncbi:MAG: chorismate mutase [Rikenellaceae bacterium]|jgi:prephenate dehydratase|nr:chorismate mutase [Rikenellaceae bacterium]
MKIALQGFEGSYHHSVAMEYFGREHDFVWCLNFREVARMVEKAEADYGVMAIENSIAGSIIPNYSILQNSRLQVAGEAYLKITHCLMTLPGVRMEDVEEVYSHQMALNQCVDFLEEHPQWRLIESSDTARSAQMVGEKRLANAAAIASETAAELFGLEIRQRGINSIRNNYTRFMILKRHDLIIPPDANKASLYFKISHERGALVRVLTQMADESINLSKLQSYPIPNEPWHYLFHVDMEFDDLTDYVSAIDRIQQVADGVYVYGVYKRGNGVVG